MSLILSCLQNWHCMNLFMNLHHIFTVHAFTIVLFGNTGDLLHDSVEIHPPKAVVGYYYNMYVFACLSNGWTNSSTAVTAPTQDPPYLS